MFASLAALFRWRNSKRDGFAPYLDSRCNDVYNLLFCDKVSAYRRELKGESRDGLAVLVAAEPYVAGLRAIAEDASQSSRMRLFASHRLRELAEPMVKRELLGVVVEVRLQDGLDVLAAYRDGGVHYIHHREVVSATEPAPTAWQPVLLRLFNASEAAVERIGPWVQPRIAPPTTGMIRMSFLVTDGLYFGQGLLHVMDKDELAGPIIAASTELLKLVTQESNS